ncbi:hypothetical protein FJZ19_01380 [Candidatus Pacearchaeota archaeon]|nr:hypothetical protein [Candidatus Pacearchaeota archaeon]
MENKIILIGGVPGTGKSTLATELAKSFGIEHVIHTDIIRDVMRSYEDKTKNPLLFDVSHKCWKYFGELNNCNVIKGFFEHTFLMKSIIKKLIFNNIKAGTSAVIEGVHITPFLALEIPKNIPIFILSINNKNEHFKMFDNKNNRRTIKNEEWYENYNNISLIQDKISLLAEKLSPNFNVHLIENKSFDKTLDEINFILKNGRLERMRLCC